MTHPLNGLHSLIRPRRNRQSAWVRRLTQETVLTVDNLILPVFVHDEPHDALVPSLGVHRLGFDGLRRVAQRAAALGIPALAVFPCTPDHHKTWDGRHAHAADNLACQAAGVLLAEGLPLGLIADVALDPYTIHGHDGIVHQATIMNDATVYALCQQALTLAQAGYHALAPSDMMDGRIGAIRRYLDVHDFQQTIIIAYAAKYASAFYRPFRDAVGSSGSVVDPALLPADGKRTYQMHPANRREAMRECALDVAEGADMLMVKPGLPYLDVIYQVRQTFDLPLLGYQVSGEYAMLRNLPEADYKECLWETLIALRRAGADAILTYGALDMAEWLRAC